MTEPRVCCFASGWTGKRRDWLGSSLSPTARKGMRYRSRITPSLFLTLCVSGPQPFNDCSQRARDEPNISRAGGNDETEMTGYEREHTSRQDDIAKSSLPMLTRGTFATFSSTSGTEASGVNSDVETAKKTSVLSSCTSIWFMKEHEQ